MVGCNAVYYAARGIVVAYTPIVTISGERIQPLPKNDERTIKFANEEKEFLGCRGAKQDVFKGDNTYHCHTLIITPLFCLRQSYGLLCQLSYHA
jgi:hypothetical protein